MLELPGSVVHAQEQPAEASPSVSALSDSADQAQTLGTVTVKARRREESSQSVPTPLTAVDGKTLESHGVSRVQDLQQLAPSLNMQIWHPAQNSLSIRGIGNNPRNDGLEGSTAVYLDNVYLSRPGMAVFDLLDIEQLEILRGPQGTLFGKNSTAGVINLTSRGPTFDPQRRLSVSAGQYGYRQYQGSFSGPLSETLAGRLTLSRTERDGFIENVYNGKHEGSTRNGVRGQLLFKPNERFDLRVIADYDEDDQDLTRSFVSYGPLAATRARLGRVGANVIADPKDFKVNSNSRNGTNVYQHGISAEANWHLDNDFTLTSVSAWRVWEFSPHNDDLTDATAWTRMGVTANANQFSQEIRLASPKDERFDYVLGAYYFKGNVGSNFFYDYGPDADLWQNTPQGTLANVHTRSPSQIGTDSYALFGQGTLHLDSRWDLTVGLRGTYEEKQGRIRRYAPVGPDASASALAARQASFGAYDSGNLSISGSSPSGLLTLSYKASPDLLIYTSVSHGEKSGGINPTVPNASAGADSLLIGAERANNAELGFKSTLFDQRLQFNANLFWTGINGYQATYWDQQYNTSYLTNVGSVRSRGVEFEATAIVLRGLTLNVNGSFVDATYTDYSNAPCPPEVGGSLCNFNGERVMGSPRQIFNANAHYEWRQTQRITPYANLSYSYRGESYGSSDNSRYSLIPSYSLANLSAGVRIDDGDAQWDLSIWARNLFDKFYYTNLASGGGGLFVGTIGEPRTLGASLAYDF
ncbi:TonB-dependent receptor [Pseudomonas aeruginosa]